MSQSQPSLAASMSPSAAVYGRLRVLVAAILGRLHVSVSGHIWPPLCSSRSHLWLPSSCPHQQPSLAAPSPVSFPVRRDFVAPSVSPSAAVYGRLRPYFSFSSSTVHIRWRILNGVLVECTCPANPVMNRWLFSAERICRCVFRST